MSPAVVTGLLFMMVLMFKTDSADGICGLTSVGSCGSGWYRLDDSRCVMLNPTTVTFDDAELFCQNEGGHLASPGTGIDYHRVACLIDIVNMDNFHWVGGSRQQGIFQWVDGSGPVDFFYTFSDEAGLDCLQMRSWINWRNTVCSEKRPFLCQKTV